MDQRQADQSESATGDRGGSEAEQFVVGDLPRGLDERGDLSRGQSGARVGQCLEVDPGSAQCTLQIDVVVRREREIAVDECGRDGPRCHGCAAPWSRWRRRAASDRMWSCLQKAKRTRCFQSSRLSANTSTGTAATPIRSGSARQKSPASVSPNGLMSARRKYVPPPECTVKPASVRALPSTSRLPCKLCRSSTTHGCSLVSA